jgi:hypothetical protein
MKEIKIPFSLDSYKEGGYEVMTNGDEKNQPIKVRIICTNRIDEEYPLVILMKDRTDIEHSLFYTKNGTYLIGKESSSDLVLVKYEWEDGDIVLLKDNVIGIFQNGYNYYCDYSSSSGRLSFEDVDFSGIERVATVEEKDKLFNALAREGKRWNPSASKIENIKEIPFIYKLHEEYLTYEQRNYLNSMGVDFSHTHTAMVYDIEQKRIVKFVHENAPLLDFPFKFIILNTMSVGEMLQLLPSNFSEGLTMCSPEIYRSNGEWFVVYRTNDVRQVNHQSFHARLLRDALFEMIKWLITKY